METATKASDQQATNAALAALAATDNSYALGQLWELNKGLLRSMFWKWYPAHKAQADAHDQTADDFEQEAFCCPARSPDLRPGTGSLYHLAGCRHAAPAAPLITGLFPPAAGNQ